MRLRRALLALALSIACAPLGLAEESRELCPRVRLVGEEVELTEVEKRLACGNPDSEGWKTVPLNEAKYFLRASLQRRGYHFPEFAAQNDTLTVHVGSRTVITRLSGSGLEGIYDFGKKRNVVGKIMTPAELDRIKADVSTRLQEQGFACPTIKQTGDARTGEVRTDADPGVLYILTYIDHAEVEGVDKAVFNRYQAHQYGYPFDIRLLNLTSERIVQDALFQSAYFDVNCSSAGLRITQRIVSAKPRLLTIGFGVDTEGYARARVRWRHSRIGYRASSFESSLFASLREQTFDTFMRYYLRPADRVHLVPRVLVQRRDESQFDTTEARASLGPAWTWDNIRMHLAVQGGPAIEYFRTVRGIGPRDDTFASFQTRAVATSHLFEYYSRDPRIGWQAGIDTSSRVRGAHSRLTAQRLRTFGEKLWNVGHYDPPLLVLAVRGWAGTLYASDRQAAFNDLPPGERFFLGGDADFRGAQRNELPHDGLGFLTAVSQGTEARLHEVLPYRVEPLIFFDVAMGGRREFHLDRDFYWAPGAGIRWASPVGTLRFTAARGYVARKTQSNPTKLPHWQYFVSFGREF